MTRHRVLLAAFFVQFTVHPAPCGQVLDLHLEGPRIDSRENIAQGGDQRPVAQIAQGRRRDRGEQFAPFGASSTGVLPVLTKCCGPRIAAAGLVGIT